VPPEQQEPQGTPAVKEAAENPVTPVLLGSMGPMVFHREATEVSSTACLRQPLDNLEFRDCLEAAEEVQVVVGPMSFLPSAAYCIMAVVAAAAGLAVVPANLGRGEGVADPHLVCS
jgi:hypothetical protein